MSVDQLEHQFLSQKANHLIATELLSALKIKQKIQIQNIANALLELSTAKYNLDHTTVYAQTDGTISNLFSSIGSPVTAQQPLFSFIDTSHWYVQANFKETDLGSVRSGDNSTVRLRMYLGDKIYQGKVVSTNWAVNRQQSNTRNQLQEIENENQWVLLAQRFPVLIEILNPDPNFPLHIGASAYVNIETH